MQIIEARYLDAEINAVHVVIRAPEGEVQLSGVPPFAAPYSDLYAEWIAQGNEPDPADPSRDGEAEQRILAELKADSPEPVDVWGLLMRRAEGEPEHGLSAE